MKKTLFSSIIIMFAVALVSASECKSQVQDEKLSIDATKPYIYLVFDHIGPRKPLRIAEPDEGIWLQLVNNSKYPISVLAASDWAWVSDQVIPDAPIPMGDSEGNAVVYGPGQSDYSDIFLDPNQAEAEVRGAEHASKSLACSNNSTVSQAVRPHGYNEGEQPGVLALQMIPPGGHRLFSLPVNHVSKAWHIEVPFRFALKHSGPERQPVCRRRLLRASSISGMPVASAPSTDSRHWNVELSSLRRRYLDVWRSSIVGRL